MANSFTAVLAALAAALLLAAHAPRARLAALAPLAAWLLKLAAIAVALNLFWVARCPPRRRRARW
jgi:hypothetical protein